jgi:SAM-dependent methyltransferase
MSGYKRELFSHFGAYEYINYRFIFEYCIRQLAKNSGYVLDAGCGKGASIFYPPEKLKIVGVDLLRSNIEASKQLWSERSFIIADLGMLPFIEHAFKGALSADVLEHVDNKVAAMSELARVTESKGFFVGCSSNILNPLLWFDVKFPFLTKPIVTKLMGPGNYDRHSRFSPSTLIKTLNSTGYQMECLYLLGFPEFSEKRTFLGAGLSRIWTLFDKLTNRKILCYLKEALVWSAIRR